MQIQMLKKKKHTLHVSSMHGYYEINGEMKGTFEFNGQPTFKQVYDSLGLGKDDRYDNVYTTTTYETIDFKDCNATVPLNSELIIVVPNASATKYVYSFYLN